MRTTVDFSVDSPYSQSLSRTGYQGFIDNATYRHQLKFIQSKCCEGVSKILDVGCGSGIFLKVASSILKDFKFYGLDYDHRLLEEASIRVKEGIFNQGSAEVLPFEDDHFDFITSFHNIEHLYNPESFVSDCTRVLKINGYLLLATPNPKSISSKYLREKWGASIQNTPDHVSLKSPKEWKDLFETHGFQVICEGTTLLSSLPLLSKTPLKYINQFLLYSFGNFSWTGGEAYQAIFKLSRK